ncbi:hypothetical protein BDR06DRAFT_988418 [Suillus hirtellus]|nr:hypothetical protein BDR06DRAFT_988418 [Suillus hirtellus]
MGDHIDTVLRQGGQCNTSPAGTWNDLDGVEYQDFPLFLDADVPECMEPMFQVDDIKLEYHPSSGITPEVHTFNDFKCCPPMSSAPPHKCPWAPFKSHLEFKIAELALEACLNNDQTDHLITLYNSLLYYWDLWEWAADLLRDPRLFPHMVFDVQCFSKFDGKTFVCFIDKPFTAETFWNVQSQLPPGGKPLAFILYVDKTRLLSFGTARGYPVVACLANLPANICNGQGVGSGYIVGWLLIVEDRDQAGKPSWVNFKNAVWHESFSKILSLLASKSHTGQWFDCPDNVPQWFFPIILILSADYEEKCIMLLIRGIKCLWPCPVCLVPHDELLNTLKCYPPQTATQPQEVATAEEKEEKLKEYGLRDIMKIVVGLGQAKVAQMDKNYKAFPCWRNLKHLAHVMSISFADGSVYEDISKMVVYAAHAILTEDDSPLGYLLLRCIRHFLEVDAYVALVVHTTETISAGQHAVQAFSTYLQLNERMHGSLKDSYLLRTNFRDVAPQILHINHWQVVAESICHHISDLDEYESGGSEDLGDLEDLGDVDDLVSPDANAPRVRLGLRQAAQTFELIENAHKEDAAFTNFQVKLNNFLTDFLQVMQLPLPGGKRVQFKASDKITECRFLKVNYESLTEAKVIFGCLLFLFECIVGDITHSLALIHPFDAPTGVRFQKDKHLNIYPQAKFFLVRSIIRGALLVPDGSTDYLVVNTVDSDMFICVKELHLAAGHPICI